MHTDSQHWVHVGAEKNEGQSDILDPVQSRDALQDVVILGGGLAGLTLALQLRQLRPSTDIAVIDKRSWPVPEGAFKVGESVVEIASHYLRDVIGLEPHLIESQLPKFGLRFFAAHGDNSDIAQRLEYGAFHIDSTAEDRFRGLPVPTYNLDRGRLENHLADRCLSMGVRLLAGTKVERVDIRDGTEAHVVHCDGATVRTRWVVDATGPAGFLTRQLGLLESCDHETHASWMRFDVRLDPEDWSSDEEWRKRTHTGLRWLSTNHLMGNGYWVWLIPLASGATSVGIVTHGDIHPPSATNRRERALQFLDRHEPQLAASIRSADMLDFSVRRMRAYRASSVVSTHRWAIAGEAGAFLDPLYSPGVDFVALGNSLISDVIPTDLDGNDIRAAVRFANVIHQKTFERYLTLYRGQYPVLASPQALAIKVAWDTSIYFGFNVQLFRNGRLTDARYLNAFGRDIVRLDRMQTRMQALLAAIATRDTSPEGAFVDQVRLRFVHDPYLWSVEPCADAKLQLRIPSHISRLEKILAGLEALFAGRNSDVDPSVRDDLDQLWFDEIAA